MRMADGRSSAPGGSRAAADGVAYELHAPCAALRPYLEGYWVQEAPAGGRQLPTRVVPTGAPELLLYHGDPFERLTAEGAIPEPAFALLGQQARAIRVRATGRTGVLIARFRPWGAAALLGRPLDDLADRIVPLAELVGRDRADPVEDRARTAGSSRERIAVVEEMLLGLLDGAGPDPLVVRCALAMKRGEGGGRIHRLARWAGVSRRHLGRRFLASIGLPPKRFAEVLRFQESIAHRRSGASWAAVAQSCGLHDQAHLIRLWQSFVGEPPGRALEARPESSLGRFFRGARSVSHFYNTTYL
ncbi:MAG: helix-turn-helix domain-containing protein [Acidobacteriota bacterium]|jgi:AraC-like DNA-binding protein